MNAKRDTLQREIITELFLAAQERVEAALATNMRKGATFSFGPEHSWETIRSVMELLGKHYRPQRLILRLDTRPYRVGVKATVFVTKEIKSV